jgi:hypothetical protein
MVGQWLAGLGHYTVFWRLGGYYDTSACVSCCYSFGSHPSVMDGELSKAEMLSYLRSNSCS